MPVCFVANEFSVALQAYVEHYCYTLDGDFLKDRAYPVIREAVRFYLGYLTEYDGYLVTCPSTSPENCFLDRKGENTA